MFWIFLLADPVQPWVCFTPTEHCLPKILSVLQSAKKSIKLHCYGFTLKEIADVLKDKFKNDIKVEIVADKTNFDNKSLIVDLAKNGIPVYMDDKVSIAHNKIIIVDDQYVLTGSYNWTKNAEYHNAENVQNEIDPSVVKLFVNNFDVRKQSSKLFTPAAGS